MVNENLEKSLRIWTEMTVHTTISMILTLIVVAPVSIIVLSIYDNPQVLVYLACSSVGTSYALVLNRNKILNYVGVYDLKTLYSYFKSPSVNLILIIFLVNLIFLPTAFICFLTIGQYSNSVGIISAIYLPALLGLYYNDYI